MSEKNVLNDEELDKVAGGTWDDESNMILSDAVDQYQVQKGKYYLFTNYKERKKIYVTRVYEESWACGTRRSIEYIDSSATAKTAIIDKYSDNVLYEILNA